MGGAPSLEGWQKAVIAVGGVIGAGVVLWPAALWYEVRKCEKPKYTVVRPLGAARSWWSGRSPAELRQYAPMLLAEVAVSGTMRQASSAGFRKIANFIFGNNTRAGEEPAAAGGAGEKIAMSSPVRMEIEGSRPPSEKIAMTSPVRMEMSGTEALSPDEAGEVRMSFVMPSKYDASTLPRPNNAEVKITQVPPHLAAALAFSGQIRSRQVVEEKKQELLALLKAEGLEPVGAVKLYQYDPPFQWGVLRRNEVVFEVQEAPPRKQAKK